MTALRMICQTNRKSDLDVLQTATAHARKSQGCLQAEDFRGVEFGQNLLHLQLWNSPQAWDAYWRDLKDTTEGQRLAALWSATGAPHHYGYPKEPRQIGQNGLEFYKRAAFGLEDGVWSMSDPAERAESVRWPSHAGEIRILIQVTSEPGAPDRDDPVLTRTEPGCVQFESFRGIEYEENVATLETWASPQAYDCHWMQRLLQMRARDATSEVARQAPYPRRYGEMGFEWYALCYFTLMDDRWVPEDPKLRMSTVLW